MKSLSQFYPFVSQYPIKFGWRGVRREGARCDSPINIGKLEVIPICKKGATHVTGTEMKKLMKRAADSKNFSGCEILGQHAAEQLLSRADELPKEWADNSFILVFTDTILVDASGNDRMPYLFWDDGECKLNWFSASLGNLLGFENPSIWHLARLRE